MPKMNDDDVVKNFELSARPQGYSLLYWMFSSWPGVTMLAEDLIILSVSLTIWSVLLFIYRASFRLLYLSKGILFAFIGHAVFSIFIAQNLWGVSGSRAGYALLWLLGTFLIYDFYIAPKIKKVLLGKESSSE